MRLLDFKIIQLTLCYVIGIVLGYFISIPVEVCIIITSATFAIFTLYWFWLRHKHNKSPVYFSGITYTCFISIGVLCYNLKHNTLPKNHYSHFINVDTTHLVQFKIKERLKPNAHYDRYLVVVKKIDDQNVSGLLALNIANDSLEQVLSVDTELLTSTSLQVITSPRNPHQFNYKRYMALQNVYYQIYVNNDELKLISDRTTSIYGWADHFRRHVNTKLTEAGFKSEVLNIINALLLGQRQDIDADTYSNYTNSGTIHILAVSGLHVGIILMLLNFLLRPLLILKYGRILRPLIIIILLWAFACIAGLSPSVTRAVAMFCIISIAMHYNRATNIYNTLAISAFVLLLFHPALLFHVGFQLSYLAVISIVALQPIFYKVLQTGLTIPDFFIKIFTVTLAAQIGVAPLSLFYFHQFPGLFFISNLVVIPVLGFILCFGILVIILGLCNILHTYIVTIYSYIINTLNDFVAWTAQFEAFLLKDISVDMIQVITCYLVIISLVQLYKQQNYKWFAMSLVSVILFQSGILYSNFTHSNNAFIIFNKSRFTLIGNKQGKHLDISHNLSDTDYKDSKIIQDYKVGEWLTSSHNSSLQNVYTFKNTTILVIDSLGIYNNTSFSPDIVLLRASPKINLDRMLDALNPKQVIADHSNYNSYVNRWQLTCAIKDIPFHYTKTDGAYILE